MEDIKLFKKTVPHRVRKLRNGAFEKENIAEALADSFEKYHHLPATEEEIKNTIRNFRSSHPVNMEDALSYLTTTDAVKEIITILPDRKASGPDTIIILKKLPRKLYRNCNEHY